MKPDSLSGRKIRLTLTDKQQTKCRQHAGVARHAYNWATAITLQAWEEKSKRPSSKDLHKRLNAEVKPELKWYYESSKCAPQQALRNLDKAWEKFHDLQKESGYKAFKLVRRKGQWVSVLKGLPQYKKKGQADDRFYLDGAIRLDPTGKRLRLPHLGWVRLTETVDPSTVISSVAISRKADHWFVSFKVPNTRVKTEKISEVVGVDLGIKTLATLSTGVCFPAIRPYKRYKRRLKVAQRQASKKYRKQVEGKKRVKQSANYKKAQAKVARIHAKIANIRADATHKLTTYLAKNHSRVVIEDLNIRGMSKNHRLASAILDGGFYEFRRQITYKADWYGSELVVADRFFPSSKTCSGCGQKKDKLSLSERTYRCEKCGMVKDRDCNAADNLEKYPDWTVPTASYAGIACGGPNNSLVATDGGPMMQEANSIDARKCSVLNPTEPVQICVSFV